MDTRSFEEVWDELQWLKGKTVYTLDQHEENEIKRFDDNGMWRLSHASNASGSETLINKREF
ncbi:MAG: hypothetical protein ACE5IA_05750, partial [Dehalococcoidia bacterium]